MIGTGTAELRELTVDLLAAPAKATVGIIATTKAHTELLEQTWHSNAVGTSGTHGRFYPDSITSEVQFSVGLLSSITGVVGPDASLKQGSMGRGFEYGSINQPPHLDGTRALDTVEPLYAASLIAAVSKAFG